MKPTCIRHEQLLADGVRRRFEAELVRFDSLCQRQKRLIKERNDVAKTARTAIDLAEAAIDSHRPSQN